MNNTDWADPIERMIAEALTAHGIKFISDNNGLDFYLPELSTYIECKQFFAARVVKQISKVDNVILIQGKSAAQAFVDLISKEGNSA